MSSPLQVQAHIELFEAGAAAYLGTRDASFHPEASVLVGAAPGPTPLTLTLFLPLALAGRALENLRDNGAAAVTLSRIADYRSYQLKGRVRAIRDARPDERPIVERQRDAFACAADYDDLGHVVRSWALWPCVALELEIAEVFAQTPGPGTGQRLG
jgi:hypothetical protein